MKRMIALAATTLITLAGCSPSGDDVQTKTEAEVKTLVQQKAEQLGAQLGGTLQETGLNPGPCTGKAGETDSQVFAVQGVYKVPVAPEQQLATIAKMREAWKAAGYTITDDRQTAPQRGVLSATTTPDDYTIQLITAPSLDTLGVAIYSQCYKSPTPR